MDKNATKTVLVVEDDKDIREIIKDALELEDYHVLTANNGQEALDLLKEQTSIVLIFLDLMMPVMNGWEFLEVIKSKEKLKDIPIIVISAFVEKAVTFKCNDFLEKPIDLDQLLNLAKHYTQRA